MIHSALAAEDIFLRNLFPERDQQPALQIGQTCHVFAAKYLFEAECKRTTGEWVQISESYLLYQNYQMQVKGSRTVRSMDSIRDDRFGLWGELDSGDHVLDLQGITAGNVCAQSAFPGIDELRESLSGLRIKINMLDTMAQVVDSPYLSSIALEQSLAVAFDGLFAKELSKFSSVQNGDVIAQARIRNCLEKVKHVRTQDFSREKALELLRMGKPWVCSSGVVLHQGAAEWIDLLGANTSGHAFVVVGVRQQKDPEPNGERPHLWVAKDSNYHGYVIAKGNCSRMTWLE